MAKHRASRYYPGRRAAAWKKIKPVQQLPCTIIGYQPGLAAPARQAPPANSTPSLQAACAFP